jgi:thiol-disulfide isomerase/thioredoxin
MRKQFFFALFAALTLTAGQAYSQQHFDLSKDYDGGKILKGLITREDLEQDTSFKWYTPNTKGFTPDKKAVDALKLKKDSVQFITFMGTWCEDSHFIIPRYFLLLDAAGYASSKISLIGVDRNKKTLNNLSESFNIINVPTIIVMKNGKEVGRVVEYGKSGMFDRELGQIINSVK